VRITDKMIFEKASSGAGRARDEMQAASDQVSSGVRVQHPWDDPGAAAQVIVFHSDAQRAAAIGQGAQRASSELNAADDALSTANDLLAQARDLAVQFSNDTYSPEERLAASKAVDGLRAQLLTVANARYGGRYLFGGFKDNVPPFDASGAYGGDSGVQRVETAPGQFEDASVPGDTLFKGTSGNSTGGVDIFAVLGSLSTALTNSDPSGIQGSLAGLETSIDQVIQGRAKAGTSANVFDTASSAADAAKQSSDAAASKLTDADVFTSASRLAYAQRALDAALSASAKTFQLTLVSKL
jgi:flagellar hook-associated protein 3 FlgL